MQWGLVYLDLRMLGQPHILIDTKIKIHFTDRHYTVTHKTGIKGPLKNQQIQLVIRHVFVHWN